MGYCETCGNTLCICHIPNTTLYVASDLEVENRRLREAIKWTIQHLTSMENYSIVYGAIHHLREAIMAKNAIVGSFERDEKL